MSAETESMIKQAFYELLETKPLKRITVNDIVNKCGLNRNTFYYHYRDIPSLIERSINETADTILAESYSIGSLEELLEVSVNFIMDHKRAIINIHNSADRALYEKYLMRITRHIAEQYITASGLGLKLTDREREIETDAIKCFVFGYLINWLDNGMKDDIKKDFHDYLQLRLKVTEFF